MSIDQFCNLLRVSQWRTFDTFVLHAAAFGVSLSIEYVDEAFGPGGGVIGFQAEKKIRGNQ
jgi:hypothetical protein